MAREYYRLIFPENLEQKAVLAFVNVLGGLPNTRTGRSSSAIVFEVWADKKGVHHRIGLPEEYKHLIDQLRTATRGLHVEPDEGLPLADFSYAAEYGLSSKTRSLQIEEPTHIAASLLTSLQPVGSGEVTLLQWIVAPTGQKAPRRNRFITMGGEGSMLHGVSSGINSIAQEWDDRRQAEIADKYQGYMFSAVCRVGVRSTTSEGVNRLYTHISNALQASGGRGVGFKPSLQSRFNREQVMERLLDGAVPGFNWPCLLNATEMSALLAFPLGSPNVPGLQLGGSYQAAPSSDIPEDGRVLAASTYGGTDRPLAIPWTETVRHVYAVGSNGSGKTTLLENCAVQDMKQGLGVVYIDPKGDSAKRLIDCIPPGREQDVIYFDPTNKEEVIGLNLLAGSTKNPDLYTDNIVGMFHKLYRDAWGPRLEATLRGAVRTLASIDGMTLYEVASLLTNDRFRKLVLQRFKLSIAVKDFWADYEDLSDGARAQVIAPIMNKLQAFGLRDDVRHVIAQVKPAMDMAGILAQGKILVVRLPKGEIGEDTASLLGSILMMQLWQAVQRRPEHDRKKIFSCYVDECQDFLNLPTPIETILAQARGYGFGLTLANQHLGQLGTDMQHDVLANANSQIFFRLSAHDAKIVAPQFGTALKPEDLTTLGQYEAMVSISTGGEYRSKPTVGRTHKAPEPTGSAEVVMANNKTYAQSCEAVDDDIERRREAWGKRPVVGSVAESEA